MSVLMQLIGGIFFLLNKIFFSVGERARLNKRSDPQTWRVWAWICYIIGLFPWVIIFFWEKNWIAASVELSGLPSMVMGLIIALQAGDSKKAPRWLDRLAMIFIPIGIAFSLWDFGGFTALTQWLELGLVVGYVIGTYQLAKQNAQGYLWFVLMHVCCGYLMWVQSYGWLTLQQAISLVFIADAYVMSRRKLAENT